MSYATNPDLADARLRIAELERQLAAKPIDDVVSVIAKWTAKYDNPLRAMHPPRELRERLCEAEAELARLSAREGDAESALDDVRPGWTEEEVADAIRAMGAELAEERARFDWYFQRYGEYGEFRKHWNLGNIEPRSCVGNDEWRAAIDEARRWL